MIKWVSYREISDIERDQRYSAIQTNDVTRRQLVPIAVIDDEPFPPQPTLQNNGYDINILGDIKKISEVEPYNIILCDLQGVGRHLDERNQGAYLIDEIKRNHPEKFVIAYTGGTSDSGIALKAAEVADFFLRKDADIQEWRDKLDRIVGFLSNPVAVWKRQRYALVEADVPTSEILKIEDAFVKAVMDRSSQGFSSFVESSGIRADARAIMQSLVASGIFKVIFG